MKKSNSSFLRFVSRSLCQLAAAFAFISPADAGVVNGVRTVDGLTVYLGVVPAAVTRAHPLEHPERTMHDGGAKAGIHDVHLLVAVFNSANGQRVKNVAVTARIHSAGKSKGTIRLSPMTINGAWTYGGYAAIGFEKDVMISIDIRRPGRTPRTSIVTAPFDYVHD